MSTDKRFCLMYDYGELIGVKDNVEEKVLYYEDKWGVVDKLNSLNDKNEELRNINRYLLKLICALNEFVETRDLEELTLDLVKIRKELKDEKDEPK